MDFLIIYWCFTVNPILLDKTIKEYDFAEILKKSICLEQSTQAWCENCEKYQPTVSDTFYKPFLVLKLVYGLSRFFNVFFLYPFTSRCRHGTSAAFLMYWSLTVRWTVSKRLSSGRLRQRWALKSKPWSTAWVFPPTMANAEYRLLLIFTMTWWPYIYRSTLEI